MRGAGTPVAGHTTGQYELASASLSRCPARSRWPTAFSRTRTTPAPCSTCTPHDSNSDAPSGATSHKRATTCAPGSADVDLDDERRYAEQHEVGVERCGIEDRADGVVRPLIGREIGR